METNIELGEGQSFVIAGLIDNRLTDSVSRVPGLASLPILGNFFKSRDVSKNTTELIVMVTPEITTPLQSGDVKPTVAMPQDFLIPITPGDPAFQNPKGKQAARGSR
jgi:pilus assembly protein CpaC